MRFIGHKLTGIPTAELASHLSGNTSTKNNGKLFKDVSDNIELIKYCCMLNNIDAKNDKKDIKKFSAAFKYYGKLRFRFLFLRPKITDLNGTLLVEPKKINAPSQINPTT